MMVLQGHLGIEAAFGRKRDETIIQWKWTGLLLPFSELRAFDVADGHTGDDDRCGTSDEA